MDEQEVSRVLCRVVQMIAPAQADSGKPDDRLIGDLGFHSLAMVELAFAIEDLFTIEDMAFEQAAGIKCVRDIVPIVTSALESGTGQPPSASALDDFAAEYGRTWEASRDDQQASR